MPDRHADTRGPTNLLVAVLACNPLATFEFAIPVEVFGLPRPELDPWYSFAVCSADRGPLRATGGVTVDVSAGLDRLEDAGTIVIPGWKALEETPEDEVVEALTRAHARGARLVSICSGAFLLAATGLLDGRRATTHWRYAERLRRKYPAIDVDADVLFVDNGQIITSAGSAAGLDACLHLVRRDFGAAVAAHVARRLVVSPQREGGQAQFVEALPAGGGGLPLGPVLDWMQANLHRQITIADMAQRAAMSRRTFIRRFTAHTGLAPHGWLTGARIRQAQELLETTDRPIESIAAACGFGSAATLRHHFRARLATSPLGYRRRFARI